MKRSRETSPLVIYTGLVAAVGVLAVGTYFGAEVITPSPSCISMHVKEIGHMVVGGVTYNTSGKATVEAVKYNLGKGVPPQEVAVNPTDQTQFVPLDYSYPLSGKYNVSATLIVKDGQQTEEIAPNSDCKSRIVIS